MKILVTRHRGLQDLLEEAGIEFDRKIDHATEKDVEGCEVWGILPHWLSCLTTSYVEVTLKVPPEKRGRELDLLDMRKCEVKMNRFKVVKEGI